MHGQERGIRNHFAGHSRAAGTVKQVQIAEKMILAPSPAAVKLDAGYPLFLGESEHFFQRDFPVRLVFFGGENFRGAGERNFRRGVEIAQIFVDTHPALCPVIGPVRAKDQRVCIVYFPFVRLAV